HAAAPQFNYTVSSDGDILDPRSDDHTWYAGIADVYDIHLYSGAPWTLISELENARNLTKPWFVGEAGCVIDGSTLGSYGGGQGNRTAPAACSLSVDTWWLENLRTYGAVAVLIQNARSCFNLLPSGSISASLVGRQIIKADAELPLVGAGEKPGGAPPGPAGGPPKEITRSGRRPKAPPGGAERPEGGANAPQGALNPAAPRRAS